VAILYSCCSNKELLRGKVILLEGYEKFINQCLLLLTDGKLGVETPLLPSVRFNWESRVPFEKSFITEQVIAACEVHGFGADVGIIPFVQL
jgi:hypothetical protein